jgi:CheY-like chemotaxis protein
MDESTLRRATEPFFTTKGVGKGTGLGLSTVHGLAEQSGGALVLKSTPGVGTKAELWLPAADSTGDQISSTTPIPESVLQLQSRALTVLVVDDDPLVLSNTAAMLEDIGHSVVTVGSGDAALSALKLQQFDLMLTDHAMPRMTGSQLLRECAAAYPGMALIIATGFAELPEDVGSITRLRKPYSQTDLVTALAKAFGPATSDKSGIPLSTAGGR